MKTRRAAEGSPFRQERYASSTALDKGLNGVLVKNRCAVLSDPLEIELIWFIQYQSMQQGALEKFSADLLAEFPERLGTPAMLKIDASADGIYNAAQVRAVRDETFGPFSASDFPLCGEIDDADSSLRDFDYEEVSLTMIHGDARECGSKLKQLRADKAARLNALDQAARNHPKGYPVERFLDVCRALFLSTVPELLAKFCLDPARDLSGLRAAQPGRDISITFFDDLRGGLLEYMRRWEARHMEKIAQTEVGMKVLDALEYSEAEKALVLIEGVYGTGKTFPAKTWCEARPGKRRFIQCPSSNDNLDFFRTAAEPIGVSNAYSMKGGQMRARVSDVLQAGHLTVVIDEAHYLFPQASTRVALPGRVNWVMTTLTNYNVPVAMVATPQFMTSRATVERNTFWADGQLDGRISRYVPLPEELEKDDLLAIAQKHLPAGDGKSIEALALYALASKKRLRGIEHGVKAARHVARCAGREHVTLADIKQAMRENVMPSDSALNAALSKAKQPSSARSERRPGKMYAEPLQTPLKPLSAPNPERDSSAVLIAQPDRRSPRSTASLSSAEV